MRTKTCGVVLPLEIAHEARVHAAKKGISRSALMRTLLMTYLKNRGQESHDAHTRPHNHEPLLQGDPQMWSAFDAAYEVQEQPMKHTQLDERE